MKRADRSTSPHYLYRCFDASGRLIYVGTTTNLFVRLRTHETNAWWARQVVKVRAEVHPSGVVARVHERRAIQTENPRWNVQGRWATVRSAGSLDDLRDYRKAFISCGNADTASGREHLLAVDAAIVARAQEHAA